METVAYVTAFDNTFAIFALRTLDSAAEGADSLINKHISYISPNTLQSNMAHKVIPACHIISALPSFFRTPCIALRIWLFRIAGGFCICSLPSLESSDGRSDSFQRCSMSRPTYRQTSDLAFVVDALSAIHSSGAFAYALVRCNASVHAGGPEDAMLEGLRSNHCTC